MPHLTELLIFLPGSLQIGQPYGLWDGREETGEGVQFNAVDL